MTGLAGRLVLARAGSFRLDVELDVPGSGVTGLLGPSGAGKTTLLRAVAGLEPTCRGRLTFGATVWQDDARRIFVPPHRRPLGFVFQEASLFAHLRVRGNLTYGQARVPAGERRIGFAQAVEMLGLAGLLDRGVGELSGGERRRVALGRALLASPRLLLLDEPLTGLDDAARAEILEHLARVPAELGIPALYVSHRLDEVGRLADHLLVIEGGSIVAAGPPAEALTRLDLPLARRPDAEALVAARVCRHEVDFGLTVVAFAGGELALPRAALPVGAPVRVRVLARDVSLTLRRQSGTSILNILPATVLACVALPADESQALVRLAAGEAVLLARVTRKSAAALGLAPGLRLFAQVKSAALLR